MPEEQEHPGRMKLQLQWWMPPWEWRLRAESSSMGVYGVSSRVQEGWPKYRWEEDRKPRRYAESKIIFVTQGVTNSLRQNPRYDWRRGVDGGAYDRSCTLNEWSMKKQGNKWSLKDGGILPAAKLWSSIRMSANMAKPAWLDLRRIV